MLQVIEKPKYMFKKLLGDKTSRTGELKPSFPLSDPALNSTELIVFDGAGGASLFSGPDLPVPRAGHCLVRVNEDEYFMAGGNNEIAYQDSSEATVHYTTDRGTAWTQQTSMSVVR